MVVKHSRVDPVQAVRLVAEHWLQAPLAWQAGVAPPHSPSPAQARQVLIAVLQTGLVPAHCASEVHATQVPEEMSQAGIDAGHWVRLVAEHTPQAPLG